MWKTMSIRGKFFICFIRGGNMSGFRLFCFKQFFKVHVFCLLMMAVFRLFMNVNLGFMLWIVLLVSTVSSGIYLFQKPYTITKDVYALMAISSCISLSLIAQRFLWIALRIDLINMMHFLFSMVIFALIVGGISHLKGQKKRRYHRYQSHHRRVGKKVDWFKRLRYVGWSFLLFLFFYQIVLSYLLRPNFLTVMALSISHGNLLLIIWTYFDVRKLYERKRF